MFGLPFPATRFVFSRSRIRFLVTVLLLLLSAAAASADDSLWDIEIEGYGEFAFSWKDYGPSQSRDGGSQKDSRLVFDQTRFVLEVEGRVPGPKLSFEAEVEFEHGGTGAELEVEDEEFGEYEQEVEKGGEVVVEELFLRKGIGDYFSVRGGRFYLALGLLQDYHLPTQYLGAMRPESETTVIPGVWDEMGLEVEFRSRPVIARLQVVNGLDSTGFNSQYWVASGHQGAFPEIRATDLAVVARVDGRPTDGLIFGVSAYRGGTSRNRPQPDLVPKCDDASEDEVAPCGYTEAPVTIVDGHFRLDRFGVLAQGMALWGTLENADRVSEHNERLSEASGAEGSPVADEAFASWFELGVNVLHWSNAGVIHNLSPFVRYENYDTQYNVRDDLIDDPRFERQIVRGGVFYRYEDVAVLKLDAARRSFGSSDLNTESSVNLAAGFVY